MATFGRTAGKPWGAGEAAYQFGLEMRDRPEYRGRSWEDVESELRRDWERQHGDMSWDDCSESIRNAWESMTNQGSDEADRGRFDEEHGANS